MFCGEPSLPRTHTAGLDILHRLRQSIPAATDNGAQQVVKRIVRYVAGTLDHDIYYPRCPRKAHLAGYSDNNYAGASTLARAQV
jgi:hypothetical protein